MSDSEELPESVKRDGPRFRKVEQRRRVAISKYYGMGSDGEWSIQEIADYLNVSESSVENYIWDTEMGERAREMFPAAEERMKMDILLEKKERLDALRGLLDDKLDEVEIAVTGHRIESVTGEFSFETIEGVQNPDTEAPMNRVSMQAPAPDSFEERSVFDDEARALIREIRKHENEIRDMLSLDEPDEVHTKHEGDAVVEQKIYNFDGIDDGLPDAEVVDVESEVESDVSTDMVGPEEDE